MKRLLFAILLISATANSATYYVTQSGGGLHDGSSWDNAFDHPDSLNTYMTSNDTAQFATGTWRGFTLSPVANGVYACSSFAATNGAGTSQFAKIYGSDSVSAWTVYSGNVYQATHATTTADLEPSELWQGDSWMQRQTSLGAVDAAGEWYTDGATIYAYVTDEGSGYDPDNYAMEYTDNIVVDIGSGVDGVEFYGVELAYGGHRVINAGTFVDDLTLRKCNLKNAAGWTGVNSGIIGANLSDPVRTGWQIVSCTLGGAWGHKDPGHVSETDYSLLGNGSPIIIYGVSQMLVDSCVFNGHVTVWWNGAIFAKNDGASVPAMAACTVSNSYFNTTSPAGNGGGITLYNNTLNWVIYGNTFVDLIAGVNVADSRIDGAGGHQIWNNTFYNSVGLNRFNTFTYTDTGVSFRYNVVSDPTGSAEVQIQYDDTIDTDGYRIDSNIYYNSRSYTAKTGAYTGDAISEATWTSGNYSFDINSDLGVDPGFNDAASGDFSRPSASSEMSRTYGGRTWTVYGAVQPEAEPPATNNKYFRGILK